MPAARRVPARTSVLAVVLALSGALAGCGGGSAAGGRTSAATGASSPVAPSTSADPSTSATPSTSVTPATSPATSSPAATTTPSARTSSGTSASTTAAAPASGCPLPATGFDCDLQQRIVAAEAYAASRPGTTGFVLRDRQTGAVYRNEYAATPVWTASTIKLAMTIALHQWADSGRITLTAANQADIAAMLHSSDDDAADRLWFAYADSDGSDHGAYNNAFPAYGMAHLVPQRGFTNYFPYWGFQKCTPDDLDALDQYLLTQVPAGERADIVTALQHVDPDQQWGVWGAGPAAQPGNKDGWSLEQGGQVMNSVGFVGPDQRYTLAMMNSLNGEGGYDTGRATVTQVAAILFAGRF